MKKRIVSIVLLAVLVLSLAFTVTAACDHTYMYIYSEEIGPYEYYNDVYCGRDRIAHYVCTKCNDIMDIPLVPALYPHSYNEIHYMGTFASGVEWWYGDCINCGARIDIFE